MKRFWVVLLSLGLVAAFSTSAFAVSADFEGKVYYRAWYISNPTMQADDNVPKTAPDGGGAAGKTTASFVDQRIRIYPVFKIADGLTLRMRMDFLEDKWGASEPASWSGSSSGADVMKQNLQVDHAYVIFDTKIGRFSVGPQESVLAWGTKYMNATSAGPAVQYSYRFGNWQVGGAWKINADNTAMGTPWTTAQADNDSDAYAFQARYRTKEWDAGGQLVYIRDASNRTATGGYLTQGTAIEPYITGKYGNFNYQFEGFYIISGDQRDQDNPTTTNINVDMEGKGFFADLKYQFGPAYVGASYIYYSGDDPNTSDKVEGGITQAKAFGGASSLKPGLMMFYSDYTDQAGKYKDLTGGSWDKTMGNIKLFAVYAGWAVTPKFDLWVNFMDMTFDEKLKTNSVSDDIGQEFDITGTYKIYDALTLELAAAYLKAGDAWKGTNPNAKIDDNYFLRSTLNLEF